MLNSDLVYTTLSVTCVCQLLLTLVHKEVQTRTFAATQVVLLTPGETKVSINKE